jgi:hypothetical protein
MDLFKSNINLISIWRFCNRKNEVERKEKYIGEIKNGCNVDARM